MDLRREVLSLLAEEGAAERLMEEPAAGAATQNVAVNRGTRLGPYEVTELIGAGGMGEVYRATDTRLGREAARQVTESRADDYCPAWSRDGRWVYFCSNRSGRFEIWRVPSQGGDATQVTDTGGVRPAVSPDGKTILYTVRKPPSADLMLIENFR